MEGVHLETPLRLTGSQNSVQVLYRSAVSQQTLEIAVPGSGAVTAIRVSPSRPARLTFIYAPGAGSNLDDPFGAFASEALAVRDIETVRIQFPYTEAKRRSPDRAPVLEATWRAAIEAIGANNRTIVVGGRSMGGRIASQVVAQGISVDGLALFAYPLHQPGHPERSRDGHLSSIASPTLFCSGTRDAFASPEELASAAAMAPRSTAYLLDGADHGFSVLKSSGRVREDVWGEAVEAMLRFLEESRLLPAE